MSIPPSLSRQRKINVLSPKNLSEDLIIEVLSLLKVKSLMRFKCVRKSWYSLISNPFFIEKHLLKSSQTNTCRYLRPNLQVHRQRLSSGCWLLQWIDMLAL